MDIRIPSRKRNNRQEEDQGAVMFDLTGGSNASDYLANRNSRRQSSAQNVADFSAGASNALGIPEGNAFEVNVRNDEPIIKRIENTTPVSSWLGDLQINLATAVIILVMFTLLLASAYLPEMIPFALPCLVVFMLITSLESFGKERIRLYAVIAIAVLLVAALVVFRKYIGNGWALIMNQLYDEAETAQAYVYNRFSVGSTGENDPDRCMHAALLWGSSLIGLVMALPHVTARRAVAYGLAVVTMIAFAYYGLIPSGVCIAILAAALILVLARGHLMASLPVLLLAMIVFGAIMLIDPGENYGISRADENFRDRFALLSAYLDSEDTDIDDLSQLEDDIQDREDQDTNNAENGDTGVSRGIVIAGILVLIAAAIGAAVWMLWSRVRKRRALNRAGIDSNDPREAVVAMFPYAVRWLQPAGIDISGKNFASLIPMVRSELTEQYADSYSSMYELWKEAAYSDHDVTEESRMAMRSFLNDTTSMVRSGSSLKDKVVNTFRYAL